MTRGLVRACHYLYYYYYYYYYHHYYYYFYFYYHSLIMKVMWWCGQGLYCLMNSWISSRALRRNSGDSNGGR